jgi:hypothetical protein
MAKSINLKAKFSADTTDIKKGAKESQEAIKEFNSQAGSAIDQFAGLFGTSMGQIGAAVKSFQGGMLAMGNSIKTTATDTGRLSKAMATLKVALAATGIGLLIVALGSLVVYFKKSQDGADKLGQILEPFKVLFNLLTDTVAALGRGIVKCFTDPLSVIKSFWIAIKSQIVNRIIGLIEMFGSLGRAIKAAFSFEWGTLTKEAINFKEAFVKSFTGLDKAQQEATQNYLTGIGKKMKAGKDLKALEQQLEKDKIAFIVEEANLQQKIAEAREKAADAESYSAKERLAANTEAMRLTELLGNKRISLATRERDILVAQNALAENMNEDYEKEAQLSAEILRIQASISDEKRSLLRRQNTLNEAVNKQLAHEKRIAELKGLSVPIIEAKIKTPDLVMKAPSIDTKDAIAKYSGAIEEIKGVAIDLSDFLSDAMGGIIETFAEGFGQLLSGEADLKGFARMVGGTFADMAIQVGKIAIGVGIAGLGIKAALESMNPYAAIAAGVALVALGSAAKSSLRAAAAGATGGFSSNSPGSSDLDVRRSSSSDFGVKSININLSGELKAQGNQLVAVIKNENIRKGLVT